MDSDATFKVHKVEEDFGFLDEYDKSGYQTDSGKVWVSHKFFNMECATILMWHKSACDSNEVALALFSLFISFFFFPFADKIQALPSWSLPLFVCHTKCYTFFRGSFSNLHYILPHLPLFQMNVQAIVGIHVMITS